MFSPVLSKTSNFSITRGADIWISFIVILFLFSEVFGGLIRYTFVRADLIPLIYLPKGLVALTITFVLYRSIAFGQISPILLSALCLSVSWAIVGLLFLGDAKQVAFGVWVLVPLLFGVVAYPSFVYLLPSNRFFLGALLVLATVGVLVDAFYQMPWNSILFRMGDLELETSREWSAYGIHRVSGFSRASFDAANQIVLLALFYVSMVRGVCVKWLLWFAGGAAILCTTSKGPLGAFVIFSIVLVLRYILPVHLWKLGLPLVAVASAALPLTTKLIEYSIQFPSVAYAFIFSSFQDRLAETWPGTIDLIREEGSLVFGRGLGAIGQAQKLFEPGLYSPADNLFLYIYAVGGVVGVTVLAYYVFSTVRLKISRSGLDLFFFLVAIDVFLVGMVTNVIEGGFLAFFLGLSLRHGHVMRPRSWPRFPSVGTQPKPALSGASQGAWHAEAAVR